jgi:hypothetical protein
VARKTRARSSHCSTANVTLNTTEAMTSTAAARVALMIRPPMAMPRSTAMRSIGAAKYSSRLPWLFSQYSWAAIIQTTFSQKAVIAPPMTAKPTYASGACSAR